MSSKQLRIPGLESLEKKAGNARRKRQTLEQQMRIMADRILRLEMEVSILKTQLKKLHPREKETGGPDCYFYSDDRCLGRPADTCPWSVKVGDWEWLCAYPWKQ